MEPEEIFKMMREYNSQLQSQLESERARVDLLLRYIGVQDRELHHSEGTTHKRELPMSDKKRWPAVRDQLEKKYGKAAQVAADELKSEMDKEMEDAETA